MNTFSGLFSAPVLHFGNRVEGRSIRGLRSIVSLFALGTMLVFSGALWAQSMAGAPPAFSGMNPGAVATPGGMYSSVAGLEHLNLEINMERSSTVKDEWRKTGRDSACFFAPLNTVHDLAVGAATLAVPKDAKKEYGKACEAILAGKNEEAEKYLRKAIEIFPKYAASWVLLGQILEQRSSLPEAQQACTNAVAADDHYLQAYICLADVAGREGNWQEVLNQADRALNLDPTSNAASYVYECAADLSLQKLPEAEQSALKAEGIEIKAQEKDPRVHILLAQVYEQKGDAAKEADQLREILKMVPNPQAQAEVNQALVELGKQTKQ
jgi:tetratricopeptide (TPR) repeat protein